MDGLQKWQGIRIFAGNFEIFRDFVLFSSDFFYFPRISSISLDYFSFSTTLFNSSRYFVAFSNDFVHFYTFISIFSIFRAPITVLGIETSCDDTGCSVVNSNREILGEASHSQLQFHLRFDNFRNRITCDCLKLKQNNFRNQSKKIASQ